MASSHYLGGAADFLYTPLGGTETQFLLAIPLIISPQYEFSATLEARLFELWNADRTAREQFKIGSETDLVQAQVRFDDQPDLLRAMLKEARWSDRTLTYRPAGVGGATYDAQLVQVAGERKVGDVPVEPDPLRWSFGEWMATLLLRRVDGGNFDNLIT